ncbi:MAG: lysylphosphatidylglycerol synthase transmembrane domain-containing protein [Streptosporangiaceae bacterium]
MTTAVRWRARVSRAWPVARYVLGLALAALVFDQLAGRKSELTQAAAALGHLRWGWVLAGVIVEAGSYLSLVQIQRVLLRAGRVKIALGPMGAITLAATAIAGSLPAGTAFAGVFSFRQLHRRGAAQAVAGWSLAATFVAGAVTLAVVAAVGAVVARAEGASLDLVGPIVGALALALVMGAIFVQQRALAWTVCAAVGLSRRLTSWPADKLAARIGRIIVGLTVVHLSPAKVASALGWGLGYWTLDCSCLAVSFLAVGAGVPWKGLLLAYGAGQLASSLPITPGGLGVVEGSLTIALVAFGGSASSTVAAVLLYRLISFWLTLPLGWGAWAWLTWTGRPRPWPAPPAPAGHAGPPAAGDLPGDTSQAATK